MSETNKSVLVIDTPNNCRECHFGKHDYPYPYCRITINCMDSLNGKPEWCPLSPIPEKVKLKQYTDNTALDMESVLAYQYVQGYNACIQDILKGE